MTKSTKERERILLHAFLRKLSDDMRGSIDDWDLGRYIFGLLFYRFISENLTNFLNEHQKKSGIEGFDFKTLKNYEAKTLKDLAIKEKGFFIYPTDLFENVCDLAASDKTLDNTLTSIFKTIEDSAKGTENEEKIKGLFDDVDVTNKKLGKTFEQRHKRLFILLKSIQSLPVFNYMDNSIDIFGDAYEFMLSHFASNGGKSKGEFYTPQEVAKLLVQITTLGKDKVNNVYDPTCGSGSLLLNFSKIFGPENVKGGFFGQEINLTTYNLCRINMFLHNINYKKFNIAHGDTLTDPHYWNGERFDAIVSNPPYSLKWDGDSNPILKQDHRFILAGAFAPKTKADMAFILHSLSLLTSDGTASIVCHPGILYCEGAEQKIRKFLITNNYVDAVIQLPKDLFFGTSMPTSILVLKKNKSNNRVLFIDASKEFKRSLAKNKLEDSHIKKILDCYINRTNEEYFSRLVDYIEISEKNFELTVASYVTKKDMRKFVDFKDLNNHISNLVKQQTVLRKEIDSFVKEISHEQK